eukprot:m.433867 g.433867  ORF g.433867 m.433867 type:complete len:306 (-) comp17635_c0_seq1:3056-3973(-)
MSEKKTSQFLPSLYQMCNNDDTTHRTCINWSDDHKSFWVSNIETFSRMILPMYFKHNNYASFVRQLNMYGFHRSTEPRGKAVPGAAMVEHFTHPYFVKGRDDLLQNIHRKTSSGFKGAQKRSGTGKATAAAGGGIVSSKETRHMQQMLMDHDEKIGQVVADVDVLKRNQMQLANTLQAMHAQSVSMQTELAMNAERLEQLVQALAMHNVVIEDGHDDRRQREAAREQAVLEQQSHMQHLMQPPPEITPLDAASTTHAASGFDPEYEGLSPRFDEDEDGMVSEAQGMEFDSLFAQMDGDMAFDPLY